MEKKDNSVDAEPPWTTVKITLNEKRGSGTTYWSTEFIDEVFKNKESGLLPGKKLIARYDKEEDVIRISTK